MDTEAKLFEYLTGFFFVTAIGYAVCTTLWQDGGTEYVGTVAILLTGGLTLIMGTYFRFVARRIDDRPEDFEEAEIADGSGELGFYSPHSSWPILLAASAALVGLSMAFGAYWLTAFAVLCVLAAAGGLVFEYHVGPEKH